MFGTEHYIPRGHQVAHVPAKQPYFRPFRLERRRDSRNCTSIVRAGIIVIDRQYFARQAATLLKFAKATKNPELSAALIEKAADLRSQVDKIDPSLDSPLAPNLEFDSEG
jgi:hypothetical protein